MGILRTFIALLFFVSAASAQETNTPASDPYKPAIVAVLKQMQDAFRNSRILVEPTKAQLNYANQNNLPTPQPKPILNVKEFVGLSAEIDTSGCPDDFKSAWSNFILAMNKSSTQPKSHLLADLLEVAVNAPAGAVMAVKDLQITKSQKDSAKEALQDSFLQLRLVCSSHGVK